MSTGALQFHCYAVQHGKFFVESSQPNKVLPTATCDSWAVVPRDLSTEKICGDDIRYVNGAQGTSNAQNAEVAYIVSGLQSRHDKEADGIGNWTYDLRTATDAFAESAKLMHREMDDNSGFMTKFREDLKKLVDAENKKLEDSKNQCVQMDDAGQSLFNIMKMLEAKKEVKQDGNNKVATIETPWKRLDEVSGDKDWVSPTIHAGALLEKMMEFLKEKETELAQKLSMCEWMLRKEGQDTFVYFGKTTRNQKMKLADYLSLNNGPSLKEAEAALNKAERRIGKGFPDESGVACLKADAMKKEDFKTLVIWQLAQVKGMYAEGATQRLSNIRRCGVPPPPPKRPDPFKPL